MVTRGSSTILNRPSCASLRWRRASFCASASATIVRNLKIWKCLPCAADASLAEEHWPAAVELDRDARRAATAGDMASRPSGCPRDVERALDGGGGACQFEAPDAHDRDPVQVVELDGGADDLEQPRQHAHAHADRLQCPHEVEHLAGVDAARRDDRAVHVECLCQVADLAEARLGEAVRRPRRGLVQVQVRDDLRLDAAAARRASSGSFRRRVDRR